MNSLFSDTRTAAVASVLIGAVASCATLAGQPWIFPSLGPTAVLAAQDPGACRPWTVLGGHGVGVAVGLSGQALNGLVHPDSVYPGACWAVLGTALLTQRLRCRHAPAAATTLIVVLHQPDPVSVSIGVALLALLIRILAHGTGAQRLNR